MAASRNTLQIHEAPAPADAADEAQRRVADIGVTHLGLDATRVEAPATADAATLDDLRPCACFLEFLAEGLRGLFTLCLVPALLILHRAEISQR